MQTKQCYKKNLRRFLKVGTSVLACCVYSLASNDSSANAAAHVTMKVNYQEKISVKGMVRSQETGVGIAGVTVTVAGEARATTTDEKGYYELTEVPANGQLIFNMVGMDQLTEQVNNRTAIDILMLSSNANIDEVVVVGYGTQRRETVTGAVVAVKGEELQLSH